MNIIILAALLIIVIILVVILIRTVRDAHPHIYENKNKRIYSRETVEKAIEKFNKRHIETIKQEFIGEINHPSTIKTTIQPDDDSVKVIAKIQYVKVKRDNIFRRIFKFGAK